MRAIEAGARHWTVLGISRIAGAALLSFIAVERPAYGVPSTLAAQRPHPEAGPADNLDVLLERLREKPDRYVPRDIASLGKQGDRAGGALVGLLSNPDWEVRVSAARALGFIGYAEGTDALRAALDDDSDWRLVYVASESLGRLGARNAVSKLSAVAKTHWYPPVREAAAKAIRAIDGHSAYSIQEGRDDIEREFFDFEYLGYINQGPIETAKWKTESEILGQEELRSRVREIEDPGRGEGGRYGFLQRIDLLSGASFAGGFLVGVDRGEFGGELVFVDGTGRAHLLVDDLDTFGIHRTSFGFVAGLGEPVLNRGYLYRVDRVAGATPRARLWKVLPGAIYRMGILENGDLFCGCFGGNIVVSPRGELSMAPRFEGIEAPVPIAVKPESFTQPEARVR